MYCALKTSLIIFTLIYLFSCSKETKEEFSHNEFNSDAKKFESCNAISLKNNLFEKKHLVDTFKCLGWDYQYQEMFSFISNYDENSWNQLIFPINENLWNSKNGRKLAAKKWAEIKTKGISNHTLKLAIESLIKNPGKIDLPEIQTEGEIDFWARIVNHYDLFIKIIEIFERWKIEMQSKESMHLNETVINSLLKTTQLLSKNYTAIRAQNDLIKKIVLYRLNSETPWPITFANIYKNNDSENKFITNLLLKTDQYELLYLLPGLSNVLKSGIDCNIYKTDGSVSLKENYYDIASRISSLSQKESLLEVLDLKIKLMGIYDYCFLRSNLNGLEKYNLAKNSLDALQSIVIDKMHFELLKSMLIATESVNLNLDSLFNFYSNDWINKILSLWLDTATDINFSSVFTRTLSEFGVENFTNFVNLAMSNEIEFLAKDLALNEESQIQFWKFVISATNFNLKNPDESYYSHEWIPLMLSKDTLLSYVKMSSSLSRDWGVFKELFLKNKKLQKELLDFIDSKQWTILFDYLFLGKLTNVEKNVNSNELTRAQGKTVDSTFLYKDMIKNKNCFMLISKLNPQTLSEFIEKLPNDCKEIDIRSNQDFAFRVMIDISKLRDQNITVNLKESFLRFVGELMLFGQRHENGFNQFWKDVAKVFNNKDFKKIFLDYFSIGMKEVKFKSNFNINKAASIVPEGVAALNAILDVNLPPFPDVDFKNVRGGNLLALLFVLEENNLTKEFEDLINYSEIKNHKFLQLIINDLSNSENPMKIVQYYEGKLNFLYKSTFFKKVLSFETNEIKCLEELSTRITLLKKLNTISYSKSQTALDLLVEVLTPFTTKSSTRFLGKTLNLVFSSDKISPLLNYLIVLAKEGKITEISKIISNNFKTTSKRENLVFSFNTLEFEDLKALSEVDSLGDDFRSYVRYLNSEDANLALLRLSKSFSNFKIYDRSFFSDDEINSIKNIIKKLNRNEAENLFDYYFSVYGDPLIRISNQAQKALDGVYP